MTTQPIQHDSLVRTDESPLFLNVVIDDMRRRGMYVPSPLPTSYSDAVLAGPTFLGYYLETVHTMCDIAVVQYNQYEDRLSTAAHVNDSLNDRLTALNNELRQAEAAHQSDIDIIGEELTSEAESRGWCSDYDRFVTRVNGRITRDLPLRMKSYDIDCTVTLTLSTTVQATSYDDAHEQVANMDFDCRAHGDWSITDIGSFDDVNVSES